MLIRSGVLLMVGALSACASLSNSNESVDLARTEYESIQADPQVVQYAPVELARTGTLLQNAERAWQTDEAEADVEHLAYLAAQQAALAREAAKLRAAEAYIAGAGEEQAQARLESRSRQAEEARRLAELAQMEVRAAEQREALAEERARQFQQQAFEARAQLDAQLDAARETAERERVLQQQLGATETERGLVITLNDLLFDSGKASLQPGGNRSLDKLAAVLQQYPERSVRIEGFTDSTGPDAYNRELSQQRAAAVRQVLVDKGVASERIDVEGFGAQYPVATNDTAAGRQLNRRVEVIILDVDTSVGQ
jgi:outer membrane protein OmpA-like peptidoglycan-associated protein